jgi:hypothetical protein
MLNIKGVFSPTKSAAPQTSMSAYEGGSGATAPATPPIVGKKAGFSAKSILGATFLVLMMVGGATAFYLTSVSQDLRQQASTASPYYGEGSDCTEVSKNGTGHYCGSTAPGTCLVCVDGIGKHASDDACKGLPCDPNSSYNTPTCGGAPVGQVACAGGANDNCPNGECCKICEKFTPGPGQSPQAHWVNNAGGCAGLACGGPVPTTGTIKACAFTPGTPTCPNINAEGCYGYGSCHAGSNYDACTPNPGTNTCTYTVGGVKCTAPCPSNVTTGTVRCECSNGVWTIGKLPPGGSCAQLCACTGNECKDCKPTKPPTDKTPTPKPTNTPTPTPIPLQCTGIKILDGDSNNLTGDEDKNLRQGSVVKFSCAANGTVARYDFRVILPDGTIDTSATNPALAATGSITGNYTLPMSGSFTAQCRVCYQATPQAKIQCQDFENLSGAPSPTKVPGSLGAFCGGIAGLGCNTGLDCQIENKAQPDAGGVCVTHINKGI